MKITSFDEHFNCPCFSDSVVVAPSQAFAMLLTRYQKVKTNCEDVKQVNYEYCLYMLILAIMSDVCERIKC